MEDLIELKKQRDVILAKIKELEKIENEKFVEVNKEKYLNKFFYEEGTTSETYYYVHEMRTYNTFKAIVLDVDNDDSYSSISLYDCVTSYALDDLQRKFHKKFKNIDIKPLMAKALKDSRLRYTSVLHLIDGE